MTISDPRHLPQYAKAHLIEMLVHLCSGRGCDLVRFRRELEAMTLEQLSKVFNKETEEFGL